MLSSIGTSNLPDIELPKSNLNSSKDLLTTNIYKSQTEDLRFKMRNKDGDVYEVNAHLSRELYFHREASLSPVNSEDSDTKVTDNEHDNIVAWAKKIEEELKNQQAELVKEALKAFHHAVDKGDGKFLFIQIISIEHEKNTSETESLEEPKAPEAPPVPEYWNAENTSNRIVRMATSFAQISGLDPLEFADKIKSAVQAGFDQARDITGDLPGAAGKLNQDTNFMVFDKLNKWLDQWKAKAYNQAASLVQNQTMEKPYGT